MFDRWRLRAPHVTHHPSTCDGGAVILVCRSGGGDTMRRRRQITRQGAYLDASAGQPSNRHSAGTGTFYASACSSRSAVVAAEISEILRAFVTAKDWESWAVFRPAGTAESTGTAKALSAPNPRLDAIAYSGLGSGSGLQCSACGGLPSWHAPMDALQTALLHSVPETGNCVQGCACSCPQTRYNRR